VAIIGAGFGGLGAALRLDAAGFRDFTVYERESDVGGTWFLNTYPGAACDAPSHIYSFSFAQDVDWSRRFAPGPEIQAYLRRCVDEGAIADRVRTGIAVTGATWTGRDWAIELSDGSTDRADVLVPAVGQLTTPAVPSLPGLDTFGGTSFHTARWRHDVDLTGKRVGVVGTGASAIQVIPQAAANAAHVTVFQRSAPYVFGKADARYSERIQRRYRALPWLRHGVRLTLWGGLELVTAGYARIPRALKLMQLAHDRVLATKVSDPVLREMMRPDYPIACKRVLISDDYHAALARPNVTLETAPITRVEQTGIVAGDTAHPLDVIVFGTGFQTDAFVPGISIVGRDGVSLADAWADRPGAYLGLSVPGFPNMFLVYGPNTNLGSGSIIGMLEAQASHIVDAVRVLSRSKESPALEVKPGVYRKFLSDLSKHQPHTVWRGCRSWYIDAQGRDIHNWPWLISSYRRRARRVRLEDYTFAGTVAFEEDHA
jgi:cation diffusion facilitator CzcD-associated flavoprotein CzcO